MRKPKKNLEKEIVAKLLELMESNKSIAFEFRPKTAGIHFVKETVYGELVALVNKWESQQKKKEV